MAIKNTTKRTVIAENSNICKNIIAKSLGLMFALKPKTLIFTFKKEEIVPLHMLFVFYPIDVLFLDKNKGVAEIKESLMPFSFYTPKNKAQYVIELPKGTIKKTKTALGNKIQFQ